MELLSFADESLLQLLRQPGRWLAKTARLGAAFIRHAARLVQLRRWDVVVIHRAACLAGPAVLERALSFFRRRVVFDFDDAIYMLHTSATNRAVGWFKFPGKTATICRLSNHVVVGNSFLAEYARQYNRAVTVIPTSIDTNLYHPRFRSDINKRFVVGWTGSSTSQTHLEAFAPVLREFFSRHRGRLRVVSNHPPDLEGVPVEWRAWSPATEIEEIAQFDVGIMPMPDDTWSRGKCALKALQYMAMGIPAVCSAVGTNCEVIRDGENGFLARTPEDWFSHLTLLSANPILRQRLGQNARRTIEEHYSMHRCADRFAEVIWSTLTTQQR